MDPVTLALLKSLAVGGPLGIVLGLTCRELWTQLNELRWFYEGNPKKNDQPGRIEELRREHEAARAAERKRYEEKIEALHEEQKTLLRDLNVTLKTLLEAGEEHL